MTNAEDFVSSLVEKYGLSQSDAQSFFREMFEVITDELRNGEGSSVKLKGLGTFKVTAINPRASVDINTGTRIILDGRNKISFTPEAMLRDRVNGPFAQFQTVVVNDGVDFSDIDRESESTDTVGTDSDDVEEENAENANGMADPDVESAVSEPIAETSEVDECEELIKKDDIEDRNENAHDNSNDNIAPRDLSKCQHDESECDSSSVLAKQIMCESETPKCVDSVKESTCHRRRRDIVVIWSGVAFLLMIIVSAMFYCVQHYSNLRDARIEKLESRVNKGAQQSGRRHTDVESIAVPLSSLKTSADSSSVNAINTKSKQDDSSSKISQDYDSDPRIRTGAYIIVGVSRTVKVCHGQTLSSISRAYLGNGMECYVEAINGYKEVRVGDSIRIPELKLRPRSGK